MTTATEASAADETMPKVGAPREERAAKRRGKSPSLAAASGISAQIMVQPFRAPMPETMTASATRFPAHDPPPTMWSAATEYEALLASWASALVGRVPNTA